MFAQRLKELRKLNGLSQAALSSLLGVTQQAVGKWETGRSTPDPQTVARLAEILDTPSDVLLGLRKEPGVSAAVDQGKEWGTGGKAHIEQYSHRNVGHGHIQYLRV